ncbi:ZIP family metal transporter [Solirubrobacter soli]|uniref:ZIP family metal transporter n=1 Tax=Solirubrobacter soli TaxID=363832 RepID=UPI0003F93013|nr:membrane protein [Solirubrobacter soli]
MTAALGWGALAASSLVIGALLGIARHWPHVLIGLVLAFGAGALISAVSFDLFAEGVKESGAAVAIGLAVGGLTYWGASHALPDTGGTALALGAFLDGIPEQLVLGIGLADGQGVGIGLLAAIFVSNLPESIGSAADMKASKSRIIGLWVAVALVCTAATVLGFAIADTASDTLRGGINGFAAGALLVMLSDSMIPDAREKGGAVSGLVTVLGFSVAAALSFLT